MEVRDIVQETGIKTILMEKKCEKATWLSGEALQIAMKGREVKSKGGKERYTPVSSPQVASIQNKAHFLLHQPCLFIGFWQASSVIPLSLIEIEESFLEEAARAFHARKVGISQK